MIGVDTARKWYKYIGITLLCGVLCLGACGNQGAPAGAARGEGAEKEKVLSRTEEAQARAARIRMPEASGVVVTEKGGITVDASNTAHGYIMVKSGDSGARRKVILKNGAATSTYDLPTSNEYTIYPLQHGDGKYALTVYQNVESNLYTPILTTSVAVTLDNELEPYLYPNQYVSYGPDDASVLESFLLVPGDTDAESAVDKLYRYVARNIAYDYDKAASVGTGYLPVPDDTLESGMGICFDYSALLATMLRVQEVPTQLVIGYVAPDNLYHAWNKAYVNGEWVWMDATFSGERKESAYTDERWY